MRTITGAPAFFERSAGIAMNTEPPPLLPNPPPQNSLTSTMLFASTPTHAASGSTVRLTLWVGPGKLQLAVLPKRHRRARLHGLGAGGRHDERLADDDGGRLEAGIEIAV